MADFNFLKQAKVYFVQATSLGEGVPLPDPTSGTPAYFMQVRDISFSQTFTEESYSVKTLHTQSMFEGSVITKANPANFSLEIYAIEEADLSVVFKALLDYTTFDMYISTELDIYKLEYCVFTNGVINLSMGEALSISLQGGARKLSRFRDYDSGQNSYVGVLVEGATPTYSFSQLKVMDTVVDNVNISTGIVSSTIEIQNEVSWTPYATLQASLAVTNETNTIYPDSFTLNKRIVSGAISKYVERVNNNEPQSWNTTAPLRIQASSSNFNAPYSGFDIDIPLCTFTNRLNVGSVFTQNYEWRMISNPAPLSGVIKYNPT
jgi:hypothetical protein